MTWAQMEFDHEKHHHTNILLISASEEVIETLEDNQVCDEGCHMLPQEQSIPIPRP